MVRKARIKLTSTDYKKLENVGGELKIIAPGLSAWLPNVITGGVGFYILSKAATR